MLGIRISRRTSRHSGSDVKKTYHDDRAKPTSFQVSQWIWIYRLGTKMGRIPKWSCFYEGTYLLVKVVNPANCLLRQFFRAQTHMVHIHKLELHTETEPPTWVRTGNPSSMRLPSCFSRHQQYVDGADGSRLQQITTWNSTVIDREDP